MTLSIREAQEKRQAKYPKDRIAMLETKVQDDKIDLQKFYHKDISFKELRRRIAKNNHLDEYFEDGMIPEEAMITTLKNTGWYRPIEK